MELPILLILGVSGMVGKFLYAHFSRMQEYEVFGICRKRPGGPIDDNIRGGFDIVRCDTCELDHQITDIQPDIIINCVAIIRPDVHDSMSIEHMIKVNSRFPHHLTSLADSDIFETTPYVINLSTDGGVWGV